MRPGRPLFSLVALLALAGGVTTCEARATPAEEREPPRDKPAGETRHLMLRWLFDMGDMEAAIDEAEAILAREPGDAETHYLRATALARLGRVDEAAAGMRRVIELDPERLVTRSALADLLVSKAESLPEGEDPGALWSEAARLYEEELERRPGARALLPGYAVALQRSGRPAEAAAVLQRMPVDGEAADDETLYAIADLMKEAGEPERVLEVLGRVAEPNDETAVRIYNACVALFRQGRHEAVVASMKRAIDIDPDNAPFHRLRGLALMQLGRSDEGIAALRRFVELAPDDPEAKRIRAQIGPG